MKKVKAQKTLNSRENSKRKVPNLMAKSKHKHIKPTDNNCHILDLAQAFYDVENGGLNLVLHLTCIRVAFHYIDNDA